MKLKTKKIIGAISASTVMVAGLSIGLYYGLRDTTTFDPMREYPPIESDINGAPNPYINVSDEETYWSPINELEGYSISNDSFNGNFVMMKDKPVNVLTLDESSKTIELVKQDVNPEDVYNASINNDEYDVFNISVYSAWANDNVNYTSEENTITTYAMEKVTEENHDAWQEALMTSNPNVGIGKPIEGVLALNDRIEKESALSFAAIDGHQPQDGRSFSLMIDGFMAGGFCSTLSEEDNARVRWNQVPKNGQVWTFSEYQMSPGFSECEWSNVNKPENNLGVYNPTVTSLTTATESWDWKDPTNPGGIGTTVWY